METLKTTNPAHTTPTVNHSRVKLPKLQLHPFSGDLTQWTSFWDSYESAIHTNEQLSEIEKFNYLNSLLERSAKEAISGFALTSTNYHKAITTLQKRFGNKQLIVDTHMDALFNAEPVGNSTRGLRRLFDSITSHIRSLQSLEVQSATYASTFCPKLLSKLPHELRLIISRSLPSEQWDLDVMLEAIEKELNARERSGVTDVCQPQQRDDKSTAATFISAIQPVCCYCGNSHKPFNCQTIVQVGARKQDFEESRALLYMLEKGPP